MIQVKTPNLNVRAYRGWCLMYIDDAGGALAKNRKPSAEAAYQVERKAKRIRANQNFPVNVWVVAFWSLNGGLYRGLGHVVFVKKHSNGRLEIRDSETRSGARAVYTSIAQVTQWLGNHAPVYRGWSTHCDGVQYAKPKPPAKPKRKAKKGRATVTTNILNVRNSPKASGKAVATYKKGEKFNYDSYIDTNGYRWLSYISYKGQRRYVAQKTLNGKESYVKGGA